MELALLVNAFMHFIDLPERDFADLEMPDDTDLTLVLDEKKNLLKMTSRQTGELIADALIESRTPEPVIEMGGTATHNDGLGILAALGSTTHYRPHSAPLPIYWIYITIRGFGKSVWKID
jgi:glycerate kinase